MLPVEENFKEKIPSNENNDVYLQPSSNDRQPASIIEPTLIPLKQWIAEGILKGQTVGCFISDPQNGNIVEADAACCKMFGYIRVEFLKLPISQLIKQSYLDKFKKAAITISEGQKLNGEALFLGKEGLTFSGEWYIEGLHGAGGFKAICFIRQFMSPQPGSGIKEPYGTLEKSLFKNQAYLPTNFFSTQNLNYLQNLIIQQLNLVIEWDTFSLFGIQDTEVVLINHLGITPFEKVLATSFKVDQHSILNEIILKKQVIKLTDALHKKDLEKSLKHLISLIAEPDFKKSNSFMAIPLVLNEQVLGFYIISHHLGDYYTDRLAWLAKVTANQLIASHNLLNERALNFAVIEERQRLARELHDSVIQVLYSIELGTLTTKTLLARGQNDIAEKQLKDLMLLAEGGIAEMRTLLYELRPEFLQTDGLISGFLKQIEVLKLRHDLEVEASFGEEPKASIKIKEILYRVAQEAINNTIKHSLATKLKISLKQEGTIVLLKIEDNGCGFDPDNTYPGHLGLHFMQERITSAGGSFEIESSLGAGTVVRAAIPTSNLVSS